MRKYIYGIVRPLENNNQFELQGIAGNKISILPFKDIGALVSDLNGQKIEVSEEDVRTHQYINEFMMIYGPILPMRFGTVLSSDLKVRELLDKHFTLFSYDLETLKNKMEMGLKILWDEGEERQDGVVFTGTGRKYMEQKMQQYMAEKELIERADRLIEKIQGILKSYSINSKVNKLKTKKLVVDASYLVEKEMAKSFREAAEKLKERFTKYKFLISGPWPPYSFVSELPRENHE